MQDSQAEAVDRQPFAFTGSGGEYFRIWIVNILLSIVTLYVYSAWAKVRTRRYFAGNTVLDGSAFEYHARPLQILVGRVIAVVLFLAVTFGGVLNPFVPGIATLVLLVVLPWAVWRSTIFNARMTSYRNVRFGFDGGVGKMYLYVLVLPALPLLLAAAAIAVFVFLQVRARDLSLSGLSALWLMIEIETVTVGALIGLGMLGYLAISPWVHRKLAEYFADNHAYGRAGFDATLSTGRFYAIYLLALLVAIGILLVSVAVFAAILWVVNSSYPGGLGALGAQFESGEGEASGPLALLAAAAFYPLFFLFAYLISAFFRARIRNHLYAGTVVDGRVRLSSTVRTWALWRLTVGNLLLLVFSLGLAYPWTKVRVARFFARNTAAIAPDGLHVVVDAERERQNALGEEFGDAFDMDMDVGF